MFVDRPGEFIVQLPGNDEHQCGSHSHNDGNNNKERFCLGPYIRIDGHVDGQNRDSILDLPHLDSPINQKPDIAQTYTDDLDGVLQAQSIVHKNQLVYESETVQCQKCRDGFGSGNTVSLGLQLYLEIGKDITAERSAPLGSYESGPNPQFKRESDYGLDERNDSERPRP